MRLALIGVGLIGGSLAKALRAAGRAERIVGFDIDQKAAKQALALKVIDEAAISIAAAVERADLVVVSTPVGSMRDVFREIAPHLPGSATVTDTGSTKLSVVAVARSELGSAFARFVPGHPIAGSELSGVEHANAVLFEGKVFISAAMPQTSERSTEEVEALWRGVGCRIERLTPAEHDEVFAAVSHLPHLLAFALVAHIAQEPDAARRLALAGTGFYDFTRIAASNPAMWADICLANRDALLTELRAYHRLLQLLDDALQSDDAAALRRLFESGAKGRRIGREAESRASR